MTIELDHVFVLVQPDTDAIEKLAKAGYTESYRRKHIGQGTENVCYCFDNIFLELLWVCDVSESTSQAIARTQLVERSGTLGTCPYGIAYRGGDLASPKWDFQPPYLPPGISIGVSEDSDDVQQPFIFRSPSNVAPIEISEAKRGPLQREFGRTSVSRISLKMPRRVSPSKSAKELSENTSLGFRMGEGYELELEIDTLSGRSDTLLFVGRELAI